MIIRVIFLMGVPIFLFWLWVTYRTYKNPQQTLEAAPQVGRWLLFIVIAVFLTVTALGFLYTVEHSI